MPRISVAVPWLAAFTTGLAVVVAVFWAVIVTPGDLQQRDLYPSLVLDRVVEHSVYPLWSPRGTLNIAGTGRLPLTVLLVGFAKLVGLDGATYARLIVLWIAGFGYVSAFASFALISRWRPSLPRASTALGAMVTAVVFVVNPWTIARLEHSWLLAQWAATPLVLALYMESTRSRRRRWIVASALTFALLGAAQPHYLVFTTLAVVAWIVGSWAANRQRRRRTLLDAGVWAVVLVPLMAYQIAPYVAIKLLGGSPDPGYTLMDQTRTTISRYQDLPTTLQGIANFNWHKHLVRADASRLAWEVAGWIAASLPLAAAFQRRWRAPALHLAVVGYGSALIAAASSWEPTADAYQTAVNTVPGLWVLREPDRVVGLFVLAQAFGAGCVLAVLVTRIRAAERARLAIAPALLVANAGLALGIHASPAVPLLWDEHRPGYVPRALPADYREVLQAADSDAGPAGRILVVSSDDRIPPWDDTRILRLMEAASLANPSLTGDTRSPVPPAPVPGRWMEYVLGSEPEDALDAIRHAGFSHVVAVRDWPAGDRLARDLMESPSIDVIASGPNALAVRLGTAAPPVQAMDAVWADQLGESATAGSAYLLSSHRYKPSLPDRFVAREATHDAVFATDPSVKLLPVTPWFGFTGSRSGWTRGGAYADERQSWLRRLEREDLSDWASDYGLGLAFASARGERDALKIDLRDSPDRAVWLRVFTSQSSSWINVSWRHLSLRLPTTSAEAAWEWRLVGLPHAQEIAITAGPGLEAVSTLALAPDGWRPRAVTGASRLTQPRLDVSQRQRTQVEAIAFDADGLAFVVLREAYDPVWLASVNGEAYAPVLADGLWNGYVLPVSDATTITFEYAPQRWYDVGIAISTVTTSALLAGLAVKCTSLGRVVASARGTLGRLGDRRSAEPARSSAESRTSAS